MYWIYYIFFLKYPKFTMLNLIAIMFIATYIELSATKCTDISSGLYCTNFENNTEGRILIPWNDTESQKNDKQVIYLRNSSGIIDNETFSYFPNIKSLDIQFSNIEKFSPEIGTIQTLYLMYNSKFPTLSAKFMKDCCLNISILYIVGNYGLEIETGAFKYMSKLTHLTISKQNITNLTKEFFEGLEKINYLNLRQNGIIKIDEDALQNLTDLSHLILSHNNITQFEQNTFRNLKVLEAIDMLGINFSDFNISIFNNQVELKVLELPTTLIKKSLKLKGIIKTFPKLETLGFQNEDKEDTDVAEFIQRCKMNGYNIKFSSVF